MNRLNGLRSRRQALRGLVVALLVAAVLMAGTLSIPSTPGTSAGSGPWLEAYYNSYDMRVYVYGGNFTPGVAVEVGIAVDNGDRILSDWQVTTSSSSSGEIYLSFGPYCPHDVWLKAVDKAGLVAGTEFTTYACPH